MRYIGRELDLFARARNWKNYWSAYVRPYLGREVLEVGAGMGATTQALCRADQTRWVCLEPDAELASKLSASIDRHDLPKCCEVRVGSLRDLHDVEPFDSVVYADVLEHISDDSGELAAAAAWLKPGGRLIVLAPAYRGLFSEFDRAVGHFRRYSRSELLRAAPPELRPLNSRYLDSAGVLLSLGNRWLLRSAIPSVAAIQFWDRIVVPISRVCDRLLGHRVGKSVLVIWQRV